MKKLKIYIWLGVVWLAFWIFNSILSNPEIFILQALNEIWRVVYLIAVNFLFFEYSLPFIRKKRSSTIFNILIGILLVVLHLILISIGSFAWRSLGILLHIYTSFRQLDFGHFF